MPINKDYRDLFRILNKNKVKYIVVGAYAVIYYTEPRYTKDIDIWIEPTLKNAKLLWKALSEFGAPLKDIKVEDFCNPDLIYQIGIEPNRIDVIMGISGVKFRDAWQNRTKSTYGKEPISIININDLVKCKKLTNRAQDKADLEILVSYKKHKTRNR